MGRAQCLNGWCPVHPHVRGDDEGSSRPRSRPGGSPPRAWGRWRSAGRRGVARRFTPTCVGTMVGAPARRRMTSVHPHVRGDDEPAGRRDREEQRFTPTCVGTMRWPSALPRCSPVHPHVRGDDVILDGALDTVSGSPPRAWGRWARGVCRRRPARFTPTCVGTMQTVVHELAHHAVHPHVRGDDPMGSNVL